MLDKMKDSIVEVWRTDRIIVVGALVSISVNIALITGRFAFGYAVLGRPH